MFKSLAAPRLRSSFYHHSLIVCRLIAVEDALETTREAIMSNVREIKLEVDSVWATMKRGNLEFGNLGKREKCLRGAFRQFS